jgi:hypothetical protein
MITLTKKVVGMAALAAAGVTAVGLGWDAAQEDRNSVMGQAAAYAEARVDTAFDLVASLPPAPAVMMSVARKGDLPIPQGCLGLSNDAQAECMDVAYELQAEPSLVVETSDVATTTLMRIDAMTFAGMAKETLPQSE